MEHAIIRLINEDKNMKLSNNNYGVKGKLW